MCDSSPPASLVVEVELSAAPSARTARLVLDLGSADAEAAAVARDLAAGVRSRAETLLADQDTDLPAQLHEALTGLADALAEQTDGGATVTELNTPLVRAWRAHPAGQGR